MSDENPSADVPLSEPTAAEPAPPPRPPEKTGLGPIGIFSILFALVAGFILLVGQSGTCRGDARSEKVLAETRAAEIERAIEADRRSN